MPQSDNGLLVVTIPLFEPEPSPRGRFTQFRVPAGTLRGVPQLSDDANAGHSFMAPPVLRSSEDHVGRAPRCWSAAVRAFHERVPGPVRRTRDTLHHALTFGFVSDELVWCRPEITGGGQGHRGFR